MSESPTPTPPVADASSASTTEAEAAAPAETPAATTVTATATVEDVAAQGVVVRELKKSGASAEEIAAAVQKLLDIKKAAGVATKAAPSKKAKKVANAPAGKRGRNKKKGIIEVEPTIGTRDMFPYDKRIQNWLFGHFKEVARQFSFDEYDAPILESAELYKRKAGEEITDQMYTFITKDKYEVALRPEMTPTLARMILKKGRKMLMPLKWFSLPQCWRFETTTRGRKREHYQWNMDIVGVSAITAEAELIAAIVALFKRVGLTSADVGIKISSRAVLQTVLEPLGVTGPLFAPVCVIVDKMDKLSEAEVHAQLESLGLSVEVIHTITSTLAIKSLEELKEALPADSPVCVTFTKLFEYAAAYDYVDWLQFDASVVRGLAYYTGVVFEAFDRSGTLRAICGGGRYDKLLSIYGSKQDQPACGFGFGDVVIVELLKDKGLLPNFDAKTDDLVVAFNEDLRPAALTVATKLRASGRSVDVQLIPKKKVTWCYNYADRIGADRVVFVAPDEWSQGLVRFKYLRLPEDAEGKEVNCPFADL